MQLIQTKDVENISVSEICKISKLNRSTFYANYIDIYDLVEKIKFRMENEFANIYADDSNAGHNPNSYLKMFEHIKENQIFYKTYFKLKFDATSSITYFDKELALKCYDNKYIDYHAEFFKAGFTAILKNGLIMVAKKLQKKCLKY